MPELPQFSSRFQRENGQNCYLRYVQISPLKTKTNQLYVFIQFVPYSEHTEVQRIAPQGSPRTPTTRIAATTPVLNIRILNSVFFKKFVKFLNYSVTLTRHRPTP